MADILIVDGNENIRVTLAGSLTNYHRVWLAENGHEGFVKYKQNFPDLIITNIDLPVISGMDMVKNIRRSYSATKIIVYSNSRYFHEEGETLLKAGANLCLPNMPSIEILITLISTLIGKAN